MAGKYQEDGKGRYTRNEMTDMTWRYWCQKSIMLPGTPVTGKMQTQLRNEAQDGPEKLPKGRKNWQPC